MLWRNTTPSTVVSVLDSHAVAGELLQRNQAKCEGFVFMLMLVFLLHHLLIVGICTLLSFFTFILYFLSFFM